MNELLRKLVHLSTPSPNIGWATTFGYSGQIARVLLLLWNADKHGLQLARVHGAIDTYWYGFLMTRRIGGHNVKNKLRLDVLSWYRWHIPSIWYTEEASPIGITLFMWVQLQRELWKFTEWSRHSMASMQDLNLSKPLTTVGIKVDPECYAVEWEEKHLSTCCELVASAGLVATILSTHGPQCYFIRTKGQSLRATKVLSLFPSVELACHIRPTVGGRV